MIYISPSERASSACLHRWFFNYGLGIVRRRTKAYFKFGRLWHDVVDVWHENGAEEAVNHALLYPSRSDGIDTDDPNEAVLLAKTAASMIALYDRKFDRNEWTVLAKEMSLSAPVLTPNGGRSTRTGTAGRLDWLVEKGSRRFILERKTTGSPLSNWRRRNAYRPQAFQYAALVQRTMGYKIDGIIYDLALRDVPMSSEEIPLTSGGTRPRKPGRGLPKTTSEEWWKCIRRLGFQFAQYDQGRMVTPSDNTDFEFGPLWNNVVDDADGWMLEVFDRLREREREGHWFRREIVLISQDDIQRSIREDYFAATHLRRSHDRLVEAKKEISDAHKIGDPTSWSKTVQTLSIKHGDSFPRNASLCLEWGRCPYMDLCKHRSIEAASTMKKRKRYSETLKENQ